MVKSMIVWYASACGSAIQIPEVLASAAKPGILVRYVNSKMRTGAITREKAEKRLPTTAIIRTQANAATKVLREFMAKSFSEPIRPDDETGFTTPTSIRMFAGGDPGPRAVPVKALGGSGVPLFRRTHAPSC